MQVVHVAQFLQTVGREGGGGEPGPGAIKHSPECRGGGGHTHLGCADVEAQHLGSDFQRLRVENLPYHPETRLGREKNRVWGNTKNTQNPSGVVNPAFLLLNWLVRRFSRESNNNFEETLLIKTFMSYGEKLVIGKKTKNK